MRLPLLTASCGVEKAAGIGERQVSGGSHPVHKLLPAVGSAPRIVPGLWPWTRGKTNRIRFADVCLSDRYPSHHPDDGTLRP